MSKSMVSPTLIKALGIKEYVPLAVFSTLKIGGPARYFVLVNSTEDIKQLQRASIEHGFKLHILSGGSNTLFSDDGFDGVVMKLGPAFDYLTTESNGLSMTVGAATSFAKVTKHALSLGWATALGFLGTPGLVGGAARMNAGTRMGEIGDTIAFIHGIQNGKEIIFQKNEIDFFYRGSNLPVDLCIHKVELRHEKSLLQPIEILNKKAQEYRLKRKLTQPINNSLGSFFKNPYPHFAAQLIEKCNLKGLQYKSAQISPMHANFIINNGGASANDILYIASVAQKAVLDQFGIMLKPEIRMAGDFSSTNPLRV